MGHHNRHFAGDPYALHGAWSPPNSAANFCEEDYVVTRYIAEFINSLTNLAYVILALRRMYGSKSGSRSLLSPTYDFMSISLFVLGIGSFLYHATLRQNLQFVDDLSMILLGTSMLHGIFTVRQSPSRSRLLAVLISSASVLFSAFYVSSGKIIYHVTAFNTQLALIALRWVYLFRLRRSEGAFPEAKVREWNRRHWQAILACVVGYALWHVDLEFCEELRKVRARMGLPWAWGLELHGWWHILTAVGADRFMEVVRDIHREDSRGKVAGVQRKEE